jgi:hypothetical protein
MSVTSQMIKPGRYRTRDGGVAYVETKLNSGMWYGSVKDMFNQPFLVEWTSEGRISRFYDSRWDLAGPVEAPLE